MPRTRHDDSTEEPTVQGLQIIDLDHEIANVLAKLSICSEVSAANMDSSSRDSGEDIGGKRPPGGIDHEGNRERDWPLKDVSHFRRRMDRAHSEAALQAILHDAEAALRAWQRQPADRDPALADPQWKRWVGETKLTSREIAAKYSISRQYVHRIKVAYQMEVAV
jgi:hypothetical protein